jgi:hypothetical protein
VRALLEAAGVKDVLAKSLGSNNPINTAWATMSALRGLKRVTDVARLRDKNVDELVSRSVALATVASEEHDSAVHEGVATTSGVRIETLDAEAPVADIEAAVESEPAADGEAEAVETVPAESEAAVEEGETVA